MIKKTNKDATENPCRHCTKRGRKCDGEVRHYDIPNGAGYCVAYESDLEENNQ